MSLPFGAKRIILEGLTCKSNPSLRVQRADDARIKRLHFTLRKRDQNNLKALREKYAGTEGGDIFNPIFRKAARAQFSEAGKRAFPYANASTFLDLPYLPDAIAHPSFCDL